MSEPPPLTADPPRSPAPGFTEDDIFSTHPNEPDEVVSLDEIEFDFTFEEGILPFSDEINNILHPMDNQHTGSDADYHPFGSAFDQFPQAVFKSSPELRNLSRDGDRSSNGSGMVTSESPEVEIQQISGYLNVSSPDSNGSNHGSSGNGDCRGDGKEMNCASPESLGSGNCGSNVSGNSNECVRSVSSSPVSNNSSVRIGVVDQKVKVEDLVNTSKLNSSVLKRKKEVDDSVTNNNVEARISKYQKSNCDLENSHDNRDSAGGLSEEEEKRKARLMRNRESAQLSRQRKKHYVEELEDKVKNMHATIQDLNAKITYFMAENATLRQQTSSGSAVPPPIAPPPPGMYPHPAMMYPWMPCPPPYMMKSHGSQVPLVPIPKLKPQQPAQVPKVSKKTESKKNEGAKTKKVASVSFLGLLFFMLLFGGLVPMVNVRYGGVREAFSSGQGYLGGGFYEKDHGRVLMMNRNENGENHGARREYSCNSSIDCSNRGHNSGGKPSADEFARSQNGTEPLTASLYVPRNDKLVKIDGNLIIHSVLASEKAMSSHGKDNGETGLAVHADLSPSVPGQNGGRHPQLRALGSADKENLKSAASNGKLQQWFREGLTGPMLSSGMCTEVFRFDVSSAIVPADTSRNISKEQNQNATHLTKGRNRRILHGLPIPLPESSHNISKEHASRNSENGNNSSSSMVVSVLVDPREVGDADGERVMGTKSLSRIFVVVLIDSVKYVTYSCMLPFMGSAPHL